MTGKKVCVLATIAASDAARLERLLWTRTGSECRAKAEMSLNSAETANCSFVSMSFTYSTHTTSAQAKQSERAS